jgi:hypothetical protein
MEYIDIAEGRISQTCYRAAVSKTPDLSALSHHLKPPMRDGSQFTCMLFHPRIDVSLDGTVESQQFRSHQLYFFSSKSTANVVYIVAGRDGF